MSDVRVGNDKCVLHHVCGIMIVEQTLDKKYAGLVISSPSRKFRLKVQSFSLEFFFDKLYHTRVFLKRYHPGKKNSRKKSHDKGHSYEVHFLS